MDYSTRLCTYIESRARNAMQGVEKVEKIALEVEKWAFEVEVEKWAFEAKQEVLQLNRAQDKAVMEVDHLERI